MIALSTWLSVTVPVRAQETLVHHTDPTAKVKSKVEKAGEGEKPKVRVKMRDGAELRGHVSNIAQDSFTSTDTRTNKSISVSYVEVASVKGRGLSAGVKVAIVAGVGIGIVVAVVAIHGVHPLGGRF